MIESHLISMCFLRVVRVYFFEVGDEDPFPVGILGLAGVVYTVFGLPALKLRSTSDLLILREEDSNAKQNSQKCDMLPIHNNIISIKSSLLHIIVRIASFKPKS